MASRSKPVGSLKEIVLMVVARTRETYGQPVSDAVEEILPGTHFASVYSALESLTTTGHLTSWWSEPRAAPGGKARKYYKITAKGQAALKQMEDARMRASQFVFAPAEGE